MAKAGYCCCAPCSSAIIEAIIASDIDLTLFFFNPNIHPRAEYEVRKAENIRLAENHGVAFVDADYDPHTWLERTMGLERTARYANEHGFAVFTPSLGISRWKDFQQVSGQRAAAHFSGLMYWNHNWRKGGGAARTVEIANSERFYRQTYCGCQPSLQDALARDRAKDS